MTEAQGPEPEPLRPTIKILKRRTDMRKAFAKYLPALLALLIAPALFGQTYN